MPKEIRVSQNTKAQQGAREINAAYQRMLGTDSPQTEMLLYESVIAAMIDLKTAHPCQRGSVADLRTCQRQIQSYVLCLNKDAPANSLITLERRILNSLHSVALSYGNFPGRSLGRNCLVGLGEEFASNFAAKNNPKTSEGDQSNLCIINTNWPAIAYWYGKTFNRPKLKMKQEIELGCGKAFIEEAALQVEPQPGPSPLEIEATSLIKHELLVELAEWAV